MFGQQIAVLFPGQGSLDRAGFQAYQDTCPEMASMFAEVDDVARQFWRAPLARTLSGGQPGGGLDLLIFLASVVGYNRLQREGVRPRALVGHGFGEIAALVAADALSLRDGAEIVARRFNALASRRTQCLMGSVNLSPSASITFLRILNDSRVSVAVENSSTETVLVGHRAGIAAAEHLARMLGIRFRRLKVTCGPHQRSLRGITAALVRKVEHVTRRAPAIPASRRCAAVSIATATTSSHVWWNNSVHRCVSRTRSES